MTDDEFDRRSLTGPLESERETRIADEAETSAPAEFVASDDARYEVVDRLGTGGMGEVLLVRDRDLLRDVATKLIRHDLTDSEDLRRRFLAEAQATSQLEHPGIPPVYDVGLRADGRVYYSMKLVRGRTLDDVVRALARGDEETAAEFDVHRLVTVLERVAEAVHFAHEKGVLHRDLKPENVMLGDFGEVLVVDWGLARIVGTDCPAGGTAVQTSESQAADGSHGNAVEGTVPFMSPEQAQGLELDRRSDVYALGAILYELLTLRPAFTGSSVGEALDRVIRGDFPAVADRNPERPVHEFLGALCTRAMATDREERPPTAGAFAAELRAFTDGRAESERRHAEAEALAAEGAEALAAYLAAQDAVGAAQQRARELAESFQPWQSVEEKRPLHEARRAIDDARLAVVRAYAETTRLLESALVAEPTNARARGLLTELWALRLASAEQRGDAQDAEHALAMMSRYDDGPRAHVISGEGALDLASEPPGAEVTLTRLVDDVGLLVAGEAQELGATPIESLALPMGSYLVVLRMPGYEDVRYPVHITRNHHWRGRVRMRTAEEIGEGCVYVPGGPFLMGGGSDRRVLEVDDFVIARDVLTHADWIEFLEDLEREQGAPAPDELVLEVAAIGKFVVRGDDGWWRPSPMFWEDDSGVARFGERYGWELPALAPTAAQADAYCAWRSRKTGGEWRLPTEAEREKAGRGVDGRTFPWGELADTSLCRCLDSREDNIRPEPPGSFPSATSIYGITDAVGNMWERTSSLWASHEVLQVIKGGGYAYRIEDAHCAARDGFSPTLASTNVAVRVARSL